MSKTGFFIALALLFLAPVSFALDVKNIEFVDNDQLEIKFVKNSAPNQISTENNVGFKFLILKDPDRLVIDIKNAKLANSKYQPTLPAYVKSFRSRTDKNSLRLVFDLNQKISIQHSAYKPNLAKISADIVGVKADPEIKNTTKNESKKSTATTAPNPADFISSKVEEFDVETKKIINADGTAKYLVTKTPKKSAKIPVIVIDAGHGGKDPGTIGNFARTREKDLTLAYSKELAKQLMNTSRYKVFLTRDKDVFLPLKLRVEKARRIKADLFISIHVNAIDDHSVTGFSIYTLSEKSSDKQAEMLAQKENRADIIHGVNFAGASQDILKTLIDMSQRESKNSSSRFANTVIFSVKKSRIDILQNSHRFAGFAVLTAPDMASVLIELGYLSNKQEEKLLNSLSYKRKVATSITKAIDDYFEKTRI